MKPDHIWSVEPENRLPALELIEPSELSRDPVVLLGEYVDHPTLRHSLRQHQVYWLVWRKGHAGVTGAW